MLPSRNPMPSPMMEATARRAMMVPISSLPAPATIPTVNSSESPGRKKPTSNPLSAKIIRKRSRYPAHPVMLVDNRWISWSGLVRL